MSTPPSVARAHAAATALDFAKSCRDDGGMLVHVLAGRRGVERVAEIGTGTGVGAAWLASALPPGVPVFTAERDERLAGRPRRSSPMTLAVAEVATGAARTLVCLVRRDSTCRLREMHADVREVTDARSRDACERGGDKEVTR